LSNMETNLSLRTMLLLPMLGDRYHRDWFYVNNSFINAYIGDSGEPDYHDRIVLKYHYSRTPRFIRFERLLKQNECLDDMRYDSSMPTVMYYFKIPEHLYTDYVKYKQGRYNKFSASYKWCVLKFWSSELTEYLIEGMK